jgi:hypothetical protein
MQLPHLTLFLPPTSTALSTPPTPTINHDRTKEPRVSIHRCRMDP